MIGQVQSSITTGYFGVLRSFAPSGLSQDDAFRVARSGTHHVEVRDASSANYVGSTTSSSATNAPPDTSSSSHAVMFLVFDTSFLMGKYPASAEIEIEFADALSSGSREIEARLVNWVPPLSTDMWIRPAEYAAAPLLASIRREHPDENAATGSRVTVAINQQQAFLGFNPTGWTGVAITDEGFHRDALTSTSLSGMRIAWSGAERPRLTVLSDQSLALDQPIWGRPSRANSIFGILDQPLQPLSTEMRSASLMNLREVTSGFLRVTLDPGRVSGAPEIVHITHHAANSETATIRRATEATTPRSHAAGVAWEHAPTIADYRLATLADVRPDIYVDGATRTLVENPNYQPFVDNSPRYVSGPSAVLADTPPKDPIPGTVFISQSGAFFDNAGRQI